MIWQDLGGVLALQLLADLFNLVVGVEFPPETAGNLPIFSKREKQIWE
jgi:hypothetical protein